MSVAVQLSDGFEASAAEMAFTENISSRGARVISARRWEAEARVKIALLRGDFRAQARVAYCQPLRRGYAVGLEFLEPVGRWVLSPAAGSENNLHG